MVFLGWTWDGVSEGGDVVRPVVRFLLYITHLFDWACVHVFRARVHVGYIVCMYIANVGYLLVCVSKDVAEVHRLQNLPHYPTADCISFSAT